MTVFWLSPGDPAQRTGGYLYNARMVEGLRASGRAVDVVALDGDWPVPAAADRARAMATIRGLGPGTVVADGLLFASLYCHGPPKLPVIALIHSPLRRERGPGLGDVEDAAVACASHVVATSAQSLRALAVAAATSVVEPGTDRASQARGTGTGRLLCVATLLPRKGHAVLLDALSRVVDVPWTLRCAGAARDAACTSALRGQVARLGLGDWVRFLGDLTAEPLAAEYDAADMLVHAAHYEAWGMALAEAFARGLPVVSTPAGFFEGRPSGAWSRVPPDAPGALARAIRELLASPAARADLAGRARAVSLPGWPEQVDRFAAVLDRVAAP